MRRRMSGLIHNHLIRPGNFQLDGLELMVTKKCQGFSNKNGFVMLWAGVAVWLETSTPPTKSVGFSEQYQVFP